MTLYNTSSRFENTSREEITNQWQQKDTKFDPSEGTLDFLN